jgi:predicted acetyltransferase
MNENELNLLLKAIKLNLNNTVQGNVKSSGTYSLSKEYPNTKVTTYHVASVIRIDINGLLS